MNPALSTDGPVRPGFIVHEAGDINRLIFRLFTRWTLPRVEIRIDSLPAVFVQLVQHRITRISQAPAGGLGVTLAATTFVAGTYMVWTSFESLIWTPTQVWQRVLLLAIAALYAGVLGMAAGTAWTRVRLMRELRGLRRRLLAGETNSEPARYLGRITPEAAAADAAAIKRVAIPDDVLRQPVLSRRRRSRVVLRDTGDLNRLFIHLFTHWRLPSVRIDVDEVAGLDVQYAQHRMALLSEACNCVLGVWLAGATILGGVFFVQWESSHSWDWMVPDSWGPLGLVSIAALGAASTGMAIEMVWNRVRMMRVARSVRHRLEN
jgi:uncharacterized integral membrane protein